MLLRSLIVEREPVYRQQETVCGFAPGLFGVSAQAMQRLGDDRIGYIVLYPAEYDSQNKLLPLSYILLSLPDHCCQAKRS